MVILNENEAKQKKRRRNFTEKNKFTVLIFTFHNEILSMQEKSP